MSINKCPPGRLQSFPVGPGFSLTDTTYTQAKKIPLNVKFNWGTRTNTPNFSYAGSGEIDHVQNDYSTSLTYNGAMYTLGSVQMTAPSHNKWLDPQSLEVTKLDNMEDVIMTFQRDMYAAESDTDPAFVILVNPIFRNSSQNGNLVYLANMANGVASPVTLESLFPYVSTMNYVYYTTCVNGLTTKDPYKNILVLLNVQGTLVSASIMTKIKDMYNKFSQGDYPVYTSLGNFNSHSDPNENIRTIREGFQTASVTGGAAIKGSAGPASKYTVDKCVPFDPETQVGSDGVIVLDNGKPQTIQSIIDARTAVKTTWGINQPGIILISKVEQGFVYALVAIICLAGLFAFLSFFGDAEWTIFMWDGIIYLLNGLLAFVAGIFVGMFIIPATCPDCSVCPVCPSLTPSASSSGSGSI